MKDSLSLLKLSGAFLLAASLTANPAKAVPPVVGGISIAGGTVTYPSPQTTINATAFASILGGVVQIGSNGDYAATSGDAVTFTPFDFSASAVTPLWVFTESGTTYAFDATSIAVNTQTSTSIDLSGTGIAAITGFASTPANWTFTVTGPSFVSTAADFDSYAAVTSAATWTATVTVPDKGATAPLIGLGLIAIGLATVAQRRKLA